MCDVPDFVDDVSADTLHDEGVRDVPDFVDDVSADALHDEGVREVLIERRLLVAADADLVLDRLVFQDARTLILRALQHVRRVFLNL